MCGKYDPNIHHRRSIRMPWYDYSQEGWYYVTICSIGHKCLFGKFDNGQVKLYEYGRIIEKCWKWLAEQYDYVHLDRYVVMPNHLHGIIVIRVGGSRTAPTEKNIPGDYLRHKSRIAPTNNIQRCKPLSGLIGAFKTVSTKQINLIRKTTGRKVWQRNYYEHIIRNEEELNRSRQYIFPKILSIGGQMKKIRR